MTRVSTGRVDECHPSTDSHATPVKREAVIQHP